MRRYLALLFLVAGLVAPAIGEQLQLPNQSGTVKFAVLGDTGTGSRSQYAVGKQAATARATFPFTFAVLVGDNIYGSDRPEAFTNKFEEPYKALLEGGVKFYASLGNHDDPSQRLYKPFNMNGERYYSFTRGPVRFFVLDSNYMDPKQIAWLDKELQNSTEPWKIPYFHHPLYSSGERHGSEVDLRAQIEPLFVKHGVSAVFAGHEHFYERIVPQKGIAYFTSGGAAKLREGNIKRFSPLTASGFDTDRSFMIVEIAGDDLHFQTFSRVGKTVDTGSVRRVLQPRLESETTR